MSFIYDAGVLVAAERDDRKLWAEHRVRLELGLNPVITAPVVSQVSRSPRQASLHRFLRGCELVPFAVEEAVAVGALLARSGTSDVVDAQFAITASRVGGVLVTGDDSDTAVLASHVESSFSIVPLN